MTSSALNKDGIAYQREARIPLRRPARSEDMAVLVTFLASNDAVHVTEKSIIADGGRSLSL